jgi:hypothetical protein
MWCIEYPRSTGRKERAVFAFGAAVRLCFYLGEGVLINTFLLIELGEGIDMDEVDYGEDILGLAARNAFTIWEEFAAFVLDIFSELD